MSEAFGIRHESKFLKDLKKEASLTNSVKQEEEDVPSE